MASKSPFDGLPRFASADTIPRLCPVLRLGAILLTSDAIQFSQPFREPQPAAARAVSTSRRPAFRASRSQAWSRPLRVPAYVTNTRFCGSFPSLGFESSQVRSMIGDGTAGFRRSMLVRTNGRDFRTDHEVLYEVELVGPIGSCNSARSVGSFCVPT